MKTKLVGLLVCMLFLVSALGSFSYGKQLIPDEKNDGSETIAHVQEAVSHRTAAIQSGTLENNVLARIINTENDIYLLGPRQPTITITSPEDGAIVTEPHVLVTGYAYDEYGINEWNWTVIYDDGFECDSGFFDPPRISVAFEYGIDLHLGWNIITITFCNIYSVCSSASVSVTYEPHPPTPYITLPGGDGRLFDPAWENVMIPASPLHPTEGIIPLRAVDMSNEVDVMMTIFEYSIDGTEWYLIGVDEYGGFEGTYLAGEDPGNNIQIGREGWTVDWDISDLSEGWYILRATMVDIFERTGTYERHIYYDPTPPHPEFLSVQPYDIISGDYDIEVTSSDEDIVSFELGLWTIMPPLDYFEKDHLGMENQHNVGPNGTDGGNRYCAPTAIKNSLHRFVHYGDEDLEPPLPWHPARNSPLNYSDGRYVVPEDGNADLAMARMLSEELGTTPDGGTTSISGPIFFLGRNYYYTNSITSGVRSYLEKRGVGCSNPNGYTVTQYGTIYLENGTRWQPFYSRITYETYEAELRKCEDVILDIHRWMAGADGVLGTTDDDIGGGHAITGRSANAYPNPGDDGLIGTADDTHDTGFVDPWTGSNVTSEWRDFNGFPGIQYNGQWWLVSGMWAISPKQPAADDYLVLGIDPDPTGGWLVTWDTTTIPDGYYVLTATLYDMAGFAGRQNMVIQVENQNSPPETPMTPEGPHLVPTGFDQEYCTTTTDPEHHQIYYKWIDETSEWIGPYNSGDPACTSFVWELPGYYFVRVKAIDDPNNDGDLSDGLESDWSEFFSVCVTIPGDLNGDGDVDLSDLATLLAYYGTTNGATYEMGDINGDGRVSLSDLAALLANYGYGT